VDQITTEAARRGDRQAQSRLLRELQDPWFRLCVGLLSNQVDAQDAVQETAFRFLRDLPRFRGDSSITTWSMGIAINVTREMRRRNRPSENIDDTQIAATPRVARPPHESAATKESHAMLRDTLSDLPQRQREALLLRYFEDLSVDDVAAAMQCASGTVKATIHQALRSLREKLKQLK
jgi:RNA polymerase sigma-70 factor (ECF subfamily)